MPEPSLRIHYTSLHCTSLHCTALHCSTASLQLCRLQPWLSLVCSVSPPHPFTPTPKPPHTHTHPHTLTPMSNGSAHSCSTSMQPHATISAQQLVQDQPERYGFLRKRGQKERLLENLLLSRHINWRQRFVAIKDGCCYCYSDEVSRTPLQTFSLQGYNRIFRAQSDRAAFVFSVEPEPNCRKKVHTFAATTDSDRIEWMQQFREAMARANDVPPTTVRFSSAEPDDIYVELEKAVFEPKMLIRSQRLDDSYEEDYEEEEGSSDDSDYDRPDDLRPTTKPPSRRNVPLPPLPQESGEGQASRGAAKRPAAPLPKPPSSPRSPESSGDGSFTPRIKASSDPRYRPVLPVPSTPKDSTPSSDTWARPKPPLPSPAPKPSSPQHAPTTRPKPAVPGAATGHKPVLPNKTRRLSEKDSFIDDSDREAAIGILKDCNAPGTFLIRKSRQGDTKVLVVMTSDDVKEYKIFTDPEDGQVSLDKKSFFETVDHLLEHYSKHSLPNRQQTLTRSYSSVSSKR